MKNDSMLRRLPSNLSKAHAITLRWYDQKISAQAGDTVASALLLAGVRITTHSAVSGAPRLPFCMMGSCFECLLDIDGQIAQGCMTPVENGMQITMLDNIINTGQSTDCERI